MNLVEFRDTCVISRANGYDEWDNPVNPETVYTGECLYEEGGTGYTYPTITRSPIVYIPGIDAHVMINDKVDITTEFGRKIEFNVKSVRDINMPSRSEIQITRIELKQAQEE